MPQMGTDGAKSGCRDPHAGPRRTVFWSQLTHGEKTITRIIRAIRAIRARQILSCLCVLL
jgi:DNA-binding MarR family transcriptional regulator